MKNLMKALTLSALLFSGSAYAEVTQQQKDAEEQGLFYWAQKPVSCTSGEKVVELMKRYNETPTIWMNGIVGLPNGTRSESKFVIAMNRNANPITWTIIEFTDGGSQGCILGHGTGSINLGVINGIKT